MPEHIENIVKVCGEDIKQILVTHTHPDHSPGAKLLHQRTAAPVMGMYALHKQTQDKTFKANKVLEDGDEIREIEYTLKAFKVYSISLISSPSSKTLLALKVLS